MIDSELRQLALDIAEGKVFGSWMVPEADSALIPLIFLPLVLGATDKLLEQKAVSFYQYRERAGKKKIRGYPSFSTFRYLTQEEVDKIGPMITEIQQFRASFLETNNGPETNQPSDSCSAE